MESCPTQAVLPLVGLAAENVIRDRYNGKRSASFEVCPCGHTTSNMPLRHANRSGWAVPKKRRLCIWNVPFSCLVCNGRILAAHRGGRWPIPLPR
ncbi:MAG: hypothetical protein ACQESR_15345 [Planctomycetota bacterium]